MDEGVLRLKLYDILVVMGVITSCVVTLLLFLFNRRRYQRHASRFLAVVIFSWGWYAFLCLLAITGWIRFTPGIFRVGSPLYYLIPPCSYLYVRSVLLDEVRFRKYDWLHFLPALINLVDLMPFYFTDIETKRQVVNAVARHLDMAYKLGSGIIPAFWHFQLRWMQGIVYLVFQWILIATVLRKGKEKLSAFGHVTGWLLAFTLFCTFLYGGVAVMSLNVWINLGSNLNPLAAGRPIPSLLQVLGFAGLSFYLFFKPDILYGIPRGRFAAASESFRAGRLAAKVQSVISRKREQADAAEAKQAVAGRGGDTKVGNAVTEHVTGGTRPKAADHETAMPFNEDLMEAYAARLESYITQKEVFRKKGYTVNELAVELKMPVHHLSYVLNHHYHQRFTDFINSYRVNYIKEQLNDDDWKSFTLEGLAAEAGFSSRSTFFAAFRKVTGLSPSQYLQQSGASRA